jgi:RNA polymerase sigma-70 factor (ECF subfamily)
MGGYDMEQIYKECVQSVYKYLLSLSHEEDIAEELTQETFYRATYSIDKYDGSCKVSVWLCQIAKHVWYQELAKKSKQSFEELNDDIPSAAISPEDRAILTSDKMALFKAINSLGQQMKDVVHMRLTGELSFSEIGEILGKSEGWARTTFYRAKQKIMEVIKNAYL